MIKDIQEKIQDIYFKNGQYLHFVCDQDPYFRYVEVNDELMFYIQNFQNVVFDDKMPEATPYYQVINDDVIITVPSFKNLTDTDVDKAISYFLNINEVFLIFNVTINNKHLLRTRRNTWERGNGELKWLKAMNQVEA